MTSRSASSAPRARTGSPPPPRAALTGRAPPPAPSRLEADTDTRRDSERVRLAPEASTVRAATVAGGSASTAREGRTDAA